MRNLLKPVYRAALLTVLLFLCLGISSSEARTTLENQAFLPIVINHSDRKWEWLAPTSFVLTPPTVNKPTVAIDGQYRLHVFWDTLSSPRFIYHMYYSDGGWSLPSPVATSLGSSNVQSAPIIDSDGNLHLVWKNWLGAGIEDPYRLLYAYFSGTQWSLEEELYRSSNSSILGIPQLDEQGNIRVAIVDNLGFTRAFQLVRTPGGWSLSDPIVPGHLVQEIWPDNVGGIHFYGSNFFDEMFYSYWLNGQFQVHNYQGSGMIIGREAQLDGMNNLHTVWKETVPVPGGSVTGLYHRCLDKNLVWNQPLLLSDIINVSGSILMASDQISQIVLVWKEDPYNWFQLGLWDGCDQINELSLPVLPPYSTLQTIIFSQNPGRFCAIVRNLDLTYSAWCADIQE